MACENCLKGTTGEYGWETTCNFCRTETIAKPRTKFAITLSDGPTQLDVVIFGDLAENVLGITALELMKNEEEIKKKTLDTHYGIGYHYNVSSLIEEDVVQLLKVRVEEYLSTVGADNDLNAAATSINTHLLQSSNDSQDVASSSISPLSLNRTYESRTDSCSLSGRALDGSAFDGDGLRGHGWCLHGSKFGKFSFNLEDSTVCAKVYKLGGERYKARLLAKGFNQIEEIDYMQMDINNTFLHGHLDEDLYMILPEGYHVESGLVYKLERSLYGLKQVSCKWNVEFTLKLTEFGFVRLAHAHYLFTKASGSTFMALLVYVDDILITGSSMDEIQSVKDYLHALFTIKDISDARLRYHDPQLKRSTTVWLQLCPSISLLIPFFMNGQNTLRWIATSCEMRIKKLPSIQVGLGILGPQSHLWGAIESGVCAECEDLQQQPTIEVAGFMDVGNKGIQSMDSEIQSITQIALSTALFYRQHAST
ncbi:Retrovirus-related Pol polyprotein from transposon RE1 [Sesamum angolense]|uniref:Retrovirus-related Pol polyprotein from transposon RE1 n=1 Tax=Sesamum angolense TaxID=2727404 RepID=A0AAE1X421_9LAMI|nr:Retrovirus-related Pol polyprotein from transposon RE1 [Sesamum angolense]